MRISRTEIFLRGGFSNFVLSLADLINSGLLSSDFGRAIEWGTLANNDGKQLLFSNQMSYK